MGMDVPEILEATCGFLRQIPDSDDADPIDVSPALLQELENAATEAKGELECKCSIEQQTSHADPKCQPLSRRSET